MLVVATRLVELTKPISVSDPGPDPVRWMSWAHNAQIDSHLIHVRNLYEFFYQGEHEVIGENFIAGVWPKLRPNLVEQLGVEYQVFYDYLGTRLAHVTPARADKSGMADMAARRVLPRRRPSPRSQHGGGAPPHPQGLYPVR